ncbi:MULTISPECIES: GNAT family N-acetyltransferase [Bacillus]|uniref:GCN5 family acetyltransferase n=2 Tax=Bacillus TaxID=1386 RepID=A0A0M5JFF5_9BACI|nr:MULTISPECIES: GNAT family N-acetyltransferase [Bacillus]ALC83939.1 GCN5 family acetyltransferase [Bacillus gobiensis]MBP1082986.1 RimJ/RimL family protein N-acetyltransferase [Bacillus capparidis]MED1098038.1 GNAT family N-acetyltransferase [Bacillus capparidis]
MIILETERLFLRQYKEEDMSSLYSIFSDSETMKYYPSPFSFEQTQNWIKRNQERYQEDGYGLWGICLKENNELIGDCGLVKQKVDGRTEVEIGYHIDKMYWSKGFASEAAKGCKEYGFYQLGLNKLISIINPRNIPSIRVAEKIGFTKEKESFIFNKSHYIYSGSKDT